MDRRWVDSQQGWCLHWADTWLPSVYSGW